MSTAGHRGQRPSELGMLTAKLEPLGCRKLLILTTDSELVWRPVGWEMFRIPSQ